jgi:hypothetical protein
MPKRKKQHWAWRATKATVKGVGKATWWTAKTVGKGIATGTKAITTKVKERNQQKTLEKQPHYKKEAQYAPLTPTTSTEDYSPTESRLLKESLIVLIFGKRGSGKSAFGFRLLENIHAKTNRPCAVLGVPQDVLPQWIASIEDINNANNGSAVLVDEGALTFSSRDSMASANKQLGKLLAIARHKDLTLLFITQNTSMVDKNILSLTDTLIIKQGSLLQQEMERPAIKKFYDKANTSFAKVDGDKKPFAYILDSDFEGLVKTPLPSFWSSKVSKSRA